MNEADENIQHTQTVMEQIRLAIEKQNAEIAMFQQRIQEVGSAFSEKLDAQIEQIRQKNQYEQWQNDLAYAHGKVNECLAFIAQTDGKIVEYGSYLASARQIGVSDQDCKTIEDGIAAFHASRDKGLAHDAYYRKMFVNSQKRIQSIDAKTAKYENLKRELDSGFVVSNSFAEPTPATVPEQASFDVPDLSETTPEAATEVSTGMEEIKEESVSDADNKDGESLPIKTEEKSKVHEVIEKEEVIENEVPSERVRRQLAEDMGLGGVNSNYYYDRELFLRRRQKEKLQSDSSQSVDLTRTGRNTEIRVEHSVRANRLESCKQLGEIMMRINDTLATSETEKIWDDFTELKRIFEEHRGTFEANQLGRLSKDFGSIEKKYHNRNTSPQNAIVVKKELQSDVRRLIKGRLYDLVDQYGGITKKKTKSREPNEADGAGEELAQTIEPPQIENEPVQKPQEKVGTGAEPEATLEGDKVAPETTSPNVLETHNEKDDESHNEAERKELKQMITEVSKSGVKNNAKIWDEVIELEKIFTKNQKIFETETYRHLLEGFDFIKGKYNRGELSASKSPKTRRQFIADVTEKVLKPISSVI